MSVVGSFNTGENEPLVNSGAPAETTAQTASQKKDVFVNVFGDKQSPLPIIDIKDTWQAVALDALAAACCGIPGIGIFAVGYMIYNYLFKRRHIVWGRTRGEKIDEVFLWANLCTSTLADLRSYHNFYMLVVSKTVPLKVAILSIQLDIITTTCFLGSALFWRILAVHIVEVGAHVQWHKASKRPMDDEKKGLFLLQKLQREFIAQFGNESESAPDHVHEVQRRIPHEPKTRKEQVVVYVSTVVLCVSLIYLQLTIGLSSFKRLLTANPHPASYMSYELPVGGFDVPIVWALTQLINLYVTTLNWFKLVSGILCTTKRIKSNTEQLLLFTTLTKSASPAVWSKQNRESLRNLLESACKNNSDDKSLALLLAPDSKDLSDDKSLMACLDSIFDKRKRLDLTKMEDIQEWWRLRKYIQTDFVYESAFMDYCGVLTALLLLCFSGAGAIDWKIHQDPLSPGLLLVCFLALILVFIMFQVFQACIDINSMLERDAQVLVDATTEVFTSAPHQGADANQVASYLRAIERQVDAFDDKQQLFGITITANFRNGWLVTIIVGVLSSTWELLKPEIEKMDFDTLEDLIQNTTSIWQ